MKNPMPLTAEEQRLQESAKRNSHWKRWGPYLSERAWGTVREDYSANGAAWNYFPHDHARSRTYRWNEDGIAGICDRHQYICFSVAFWNGRDPILKERLFGLTGTEGNHGEDVKEYYFYLDSTPTHSYMKYLYKYPQAEFPYMRLLEENRRRGRDEPEFELMDTGIFDDDRYFDIFVEYAKAGTDDILIRITVENRGPAEAKLHLLPTVWFRNTWSWEPGQHKPRIKQAAKGAGFEINHPYYSERFLCFEGEPELLFTENETNTKRLFGSEYSPPHAKDGINDYVVNGVKTAVNPEQVGSKAAAHYDLTVPAGGASVMRLRLTDKGVPLSGPAIGSDFDEIFARRKSEADDFYATVIPRELNSDSKNVMRQAFAGMMWSKQFYNYEVSRWLQGDPTQPPPPPEHAKGRNHEWAHLYNADVISMPDKWEYPWYAAWDLAFHCVPIAMIDADFAKEQLILMLREWYMHPNGQLPAYEWAFGDANPPVHAWAALKVYQIEKKRRGVGDRIFLERVFHKLMLNFTWWVNRKDAEGNNIFQGGFLGLDNIGVFDRSAPLPTGGHIEQSDGTSWMAMYTLNLLAIALELAEENPAYEDVASKFWEHFVYIARAMTFRGNDGIGMWDEQDGFFYDVLHTREEGHVPMRLRSMVGLIPLYAVQILEPEILAKLPGFKRRLEWFIDNRPELTRNFACMRTPGEGERRLLSIADADKLRRILKVMLNENEFLSPYGIRALSRVHKNHPFSMAVCGVEHRVEYEPAESRSGLFGGNSNWRGPIWFPVNFLLVESLQRFHRYLGDDFEVECPIGSGNMMNLHEVSLELCRRLSSVFLRDRNGRRPVYGTMARFQSDPHWKDLITFFEYFHGDNGSGVGASHQTGWTGLVATMIHHCAINMEPPRTKPRKTAAVAVKC